MFGYIRAYKPELRVREYEIYRAVYCSLCRELGRSFSVFARFTLSYDFVFVALLSMSLQEECPVSKKGRCAFNPFVKCNYIQNSDNSLKLAANAAIIMLYYKLKDNLQDDKFFRRLGVYSIYPFVAHARKKARKKYEEIDAIVSEYIRNQNLVEKLPSVSVDRSAEPTAKTLAKLFSMLTDCPEKKVRLERLGYCLGRWVYFIDAADDLEKDIQNHNYNPFIGYGNTQETKRYANEVLTLSAGEAHKSFAELQLNCFREILDNIMLLGLESQQRTVLG